jgi:putative transposase
VLEEIRTLTRRRDSYGYRRVTARVNRLFRRRDTEKRVRRVMRIHDLQIPPRTRRRTGRAHTGKIATEQSNVRWCSDTLEIACWKGEIVQVGFALDCCDREALAWVTGASTRPWRLEIHAERLGLVPVTTPARSPQSNGMSEAFVNTLRRDYIEGAELWSAAQVIEQLPQWFEDYNEEAPHSALGMKSPREYRAEQALTASL